jgi:hypothetical protein
LTKALTAPGLVTVDDDRRFAQRGRAEIAGGRDFGFEPEKAPGRALDDQPLLARTDLGVVIEAVWHPAVVERRPDLRGQHCHSLRGRERS